MNNSIDQKIVQAFLDGEVENIAEPDKKPEHLLTTISHIFLYSKTVYKLYRKDNENFNRLFVDLSGEDRRSFYEEDFSWNNYYNPLVYKRLSGIKENYSGNIELCEAVDKDVYDYVIEMERIDMQHNLTEQLLGGRLTKDDFRKIGYEMTKRIAEFPHKPKTKDNYYQIYHKLLLEVGEGWAYEADPFIPLDEVKEVMSILFKYLESKRNELSAYTEKDFIFTIDNHSDNIFYRNGVLSFVDVYLPKESWRIVMPRYNILRLATDVLVLRGERYANALCAGYAGYYPNEHSEKQFDTFEQIYMALIKGPYLFIMGKETEARFDEAKKYWKFIKDSTSQLR